MLKTTVSDAYVNTTTHEAHKLESLSVVEGFKKHCHVINDYYFKMIDNFKEHAIIVEGATITNDFVKQFKEDEYIYINLFVENKKILLERYDEKAKMRKGKWKDNLENILLINNYLINQAQVNIDIKDFDSKKVEEVINESLFL